MSSWFVAAFRLVCRTTPDGKNKRENAPPASSPAASNSLRSDLRRTPNAIGGISMIPIGASLGCMKLARAIRVYSFHNGPPLGRRGNIEMLALRCVANVTISHSAIWLARVRATSAQWLSRLLFPSGASKTGSKSYGLGGDKEVRVRSNMIFGVFSQWVWEGG